LQIENRKSQIANTKMPKNISFLQYMRAHGNTPGPTQRPLLTGALGGAVAAFPSGLLLYWSGAFVGVADRAGIGLLATHAAHAFISILAGILYSEVFKRAANDRKGGWLFGAAFGFLLWMFAPITIWQLFAPRPVAVGEAAMGLFAAHIVYGLVLGFLYPRIHTLVQARLAKRQPEKRPSEEREIERTIVQHPKPEFVSRTAKMQPGKR
jgi:hypothetical protein